MMSKLDDLIAKHEVKSLMREIIMGESLTNPDKIRGCKKHHPNFTEYCNDCHILKEYWRGYHVALDDVSKRVAEL
jgi:hypothetical protein